MLRNNSICLALQGGGALGAFTWGVLDALVGGECQIEAISGASAGALNAVVLAAGFLDGGPEAARSKLRAFWRRLSEAGRKAGGLGAVTAWRALDVLAVPASPGLLNPRRVNPLRDVLAADVDFARLRRESPFELFVSATRVRDGAARVFHTSELTLEVVLASACVPQLCAEVEIDGEAYWDGAYSANPPVLELVRGTRAHDLIVVELTAPSPVEGTGGRQIQDRLRTFALNAPLQRELEGLLELQASCRHDPSERSSLARRLKSLRVHRISARDHLGDPLRLCMDMTWSGLRRMADAGSAAGGAWRHDDGRQAQGEIVHASPFPLQVASA